MRRVLVLCILGIGFWTGSVDAQKTLDEIIARVNSDIILRSEYDAMELSMGEELSQQMQGLQLERALEESKRNLLRGLIDNHLLLQKAKDLDMTADLEVIKTMERLRQDYSFDSLEALEIAIVQQGQDLETFKENISTQYLTGQVLQREVYPKIIITTDGLRNYYEEHKTEFDRPAGIQLQEIVFITEGKTPEELEDIRKKADETLFRVHTGDDFGEVANEVSESATASNFGNLGFFEKGQLSEDYETAAADLARDEVSAVIELSDALVILKVADRHDGGILAFELARSDIQDFLWSARVQPRVREYLMRLRLEGFIEIHEGYSDSGAPGSSQN